jgi:hypothetical protein
MWLLNNPESSLAIRNPVAYVGSIKLKFFDDRVDAPSNLSRLERILK